MLALMIAVIMTIGASAKTVSIFAFDSLDHTWSDAAVELMTGKVGNAVGRTIDSINYTPCIVCAEWVENPIDFTGYRQNADATLHMWIYVSDVDEIGTDCAIELNDINSTGKALRFPLDTTALKNGWNEYSCKVADATPDDGVDITKIASMRVFIYGYSFTLAVDNLEIVLPGEDEEVTPPTADYISVAVVCAVVAGAALVFTKKKVK